MRCTGKLLTFSIKIVLCIKTTIQYPTNSMELQLTLSLAPSLRQERIEFVHRLSLEAVKAFRRVQVGAVTNLWRTHFFLGSPHFQDVDGVIFNGRPGLELAQFTMMTVDAMFMALTPTLVVNLQTGEQTVHDEPLVFASDEEAEA
jgi:hypothetical protein